MAEQRGSTPSDVPRGPGGKWLPGTSPNPSGKPRKLRDIEAMLDAEHRTVENMRDVFQRLKELALGEVITVTDKDGKARGVELKADARFMQLYLERTLGPVKELKADLTEAPPEVVDWLAEHLS